MTGSSAVRNFLALMAFSLSWPIYAMERIYQSPESFIVEVFKANPPPKLVWLTKDAQAIVSDILGHVPRQLRQRYWGDGTRTLWVLEEIGKEELITAGFVVHQGRIEQAKVLAYRESRGMEVRYPAFLKQFNGAALNEGKEGKQLDKPIDGISGATLSVYAMQRMARTALYLDQLSRAK